MYNPRIAFSVNLVTVLVESGYIPVDSGYILVESGYILAESGYIPVESGKHAESCGNRATGHGNIFILQKEKGWNTIEFVETIKPNFMNDEFLT